MSDVITKCISGNEIYNAGSICGVSQGGHKQVLRPEFTPTISMSGVVAKLDHRFDETTYYNA